MGLSVFSKPANRRALETSAEPSPPEPKRIPIDVTDKPVRTADGSVAALFNSGPESPLLPLLLSLLDFQSQLKFSAVCSRFHSAYRRQQGYLIRRFVGNVTQLIATEAPATGSANQTVDYVVGRRSYLLHVPYRLYHTSERANKIPLVVLLHGTDERAHTTELFVQTNGRRSWIECANDCGFAVVVPESRGFRYNARYTTFAWEPGPIDCEYLYAAIDDAIEALEAILGIGAVDRERLYGIGFSNGGLFSADIAASVQSTNNIAFAALCNYMGGIPSEEAIFKEFDKRQNDSRDDSGQRRRIPLFIVSGTRDSMLSHSFVARDAFRTRGYPVRFDVLDDAKHEYYSASTAAVWQFFAPITLRNWSQVQPPDTIPAKLQSMLQSNSQ